MRGAIFRVSPFRYEGLLSEALGQGVQAENRYYAYSYKERHDQAIKVNWEQLLCIFHMV